MCHPELERELVEWIREVVYEGLSTVDDCPFDRTTPTGNLPGHLLAVWSHIMQGNSPNPFIQMVGQVLAEYRQLSASNHH